MCVPSGSSSPSDPRAVAVTQNMHTPSVTVDRQDLKSERVPCCSCLYLCARVLSVPVCGICACLWYLSLPVRVCWYYVAVLEVLSTTRLRMIAVDNANTLAV